VNEGKGDGAALGELLGAPVGKELGSLVGTKVGRLEGTGLTEGAKEIVGNEVGFGVGWIVGGDRVNVSEDPNHPSDSKTVTLSSSREKYPPESERPSP